MAEKNGQIIFTLSGFNDKSEKEYIFKVINQLGGSYIETPFYQPECDYVICKCPSRGEKYLCSCAEGKPLLIPNYIRDSQNAGQWLEVSKYDWRNQKLKEGIDKKLLELPAICLNHIKSNGVRVFGRWKVLLHVQPPQKYKAYERLLLAGGAKIVALSLPFTKDIRPKITHAFATKELAKDLKQLKKLKFQEILYPEYIAEYLVAQPIRPQLQKFQHFVYTQTPTKKLTPQKSPRKPILTKIQMKNQTTITSHFGKRKNEASDDVSVGPSIKRLCRSPSNTTLTQSPINSTLTHNRFQTPPKFHSKVLTVKAEPISPLQLQRTPPIDCTPKKNDCKKQTDSEEAITISDSDDENSCSHDNKKSLVSDVTTRGATNFVSHPVEDVGSNIPEVEVKLITPQSSSSVKQLTTSKTCDTPGDGRVNDKQEPSMLEQTPNTVDKDEPNLNLVKTKNDVKMKINFSSLPQQSYTSILSRKEKDEETREDSIHHNVTKIPDIDFMRRTRRHKTNNGLDVSGPSRIPKECETKENVVVLEVFGCVHLLSLEGNLKLLRRNANTGTYKILKRKSLLHGFKNIIESHVDEEDFSSSLSLMKQNITSFFHPTPKLWHAFMDLLKDQTQSSQRMELFCMLQAVPLLHPVNEIPEVYTLALQSPKEEKCGNVLPTTSMFEMVIENNIRDCINMLEDEDRHSTLKSHVIYVTHIVSLMEVNLKDVSCSLRSTNRPMEQLNSPSKKKKNDFTQLRATLVWNLFWETRHQCTINYNVKSFISMMLDLVRTVKTNEGYSLGQLLLTILRLLVECLALKDFIDSSRDYGDNVSSLVCYAAEQCDQIIFREKSTAPKTKAWFLSQLQPAWLKYRLVEFLFHRFNDKFVSEEYRNLSTRNLSMEKIVRYYFFLYPHSTVSHLKHSTMKSPLKDIKNVKHTQAQSLNRRNCKGETPLQIACIKNNVTKVKELLTLGADVNLQDHVGWSPLHEACCYGFEEVVDLLLGNPTIDVFCVNEDGLSPLHDAVQWNHFKIVEKLLNKGGAELLMLTTKDNKTAVDFANTDAMKTLLSKNIPSRNEPLRSTVVPTNASLDRRKYQSIPLLPSKQVEYYLLLLNNLLKSFLVAEKCSVSSNILKQQYLLLKQHIEAISDKISLQCRLYLKNIGKMLKFG